MAAYNAVRREGPLRDFYLRLRAAGKQHPRALTACIRKLVVILNAMVKHDTRWSPVPTENSESSEKSRVLRITALVSPACLSSSSDP
jgi:hypothetical protein